MKRAPKRIQRIVAVRQRQEEAARMQWLAAENAAREARQESERVAQSLRLAEDSLRQTQASQSPAQILVAHEALDHGRELQTQSEQFATECKERAKLKKDPWLERRQVLQTMEKWLERARDAQRAEQIERENKQTESTLEAHLAQQNKHPLTGPTHE